MILLFHIFVATASVLYTAYAFFKPTTSKLRIAYSLVGFTIASGFVLVLSKPAQMVQACTTGLVYLAVISCGIIAVRHKLASINTARPTI